MPKRFKIPRNERTFFNCECHTEGIILEYDKEDDQFYLALWSYGHCGNELPFWERIRWCWNILKSGLPWTDSVVLHTAEARKLAKTINDNLKKK